jgi:recombination protein RecR
VDPRPPAVRALLEELEQLPGVGPRSATRLVQYLLRDPEKTQRLAGVIERAAVVVHRCHDCALLTEEELCPICSDTNRDRGLICVVEDTLNAWAVESTGDFRGTFHVLGGTLDPLHGIGPEELNIESLLGRVQFGGVREVIVATNPTVEGEATAHYISRMLRPTNVTTSRIAFGLPAGGEISYADAVTLTRALSGRRGMD